MRLHTLFLRTLEGVFSPKWLIVVTKVTWDHSAAALGILALNWKAFIDHLFLFRKLLFGMKTLLPNQCSKYPGTLPVILSQLGRQYNVGTWGFKAFLASHCWGLPRAIPDGSSTYMVTLGDVQIRIWHQGLNMVYHMPYFLYSHLATHPYQRQMRHQPFEWYCSFTVFYIISPHSVPYSKSHSSILLASIPLIPFSTFLLWWV